MYRMSMVTLMSEYILFWSLMVSNAFVGSSFQGNTSPSFQGETQIDLQGSVSPPHP